MPGVLSFIRIVTCNFLLLFFVLSCAGKNYRSQLNWKIAMAQGSFVSSGEMSNESIAEEFKRIRKTFLDRLPSKSINNKKKYVLFESFDPQSAIYQLSFYNTNSSFIYEYYAPFDSTTFEEAQPVYSDFILSNVLKQKFKTILDKQKEEGMVLGGRRVYVYVVKWNASNPIVSPFTFLEFHSALTNFPLK